MTEEEGGWGLFSLYTPLISILRIWGHMQVFPLTSAPNATLPGWNLRKEGTELPTPKSPFSRSAAQSWGEVFGYPAVESGQKHAIRPLAGTIYA